MNELQPFFVEYIKYYIEALTKDREEFFLSLCDIEEEILKDMDTAAFSGYQVIVVDREDYSQAVRYRNDITIKKIVLLSGEGVKQIDSLKDFNEYSLLSPNRQLMWECMEKTLGVKLEPKVRGFLEGILEQSEISFADLLLYLKKSSSRIKIVPTKLNRNLSLLGIWKSRETEVLTKGKIRRMISNSRYSVVENRLTRALMNHKVKDEKQKRQIDTALSKADIHGIFASIYYEDAEDWLKQAPKEKNANLPETASTDEKSYKNSFEYKLSENLMEDIREIEQEWIADRNKDDPDFEIDWNCCQISKSELYHSTRQLNQLIDTVKDNNLPVSRREKIIGKLLQLSTVFSRSIGEVCAATPVCLATFCEKAAEYTRIYFELLTEMITDELLRDMDAAREFMKEVLLLFCREQENCIRMPYFHPIRVYYYMTVCGLYETILAQQEGEGLKNLVWHALADKVAMQFPVEFIRAGERRYALDNTTILKGYADFISTDMGTVYSVMDFKIVQQQILDYIMRHPYLTSFTICLVDISDLSGLSRLVVRIREMVKKEEYNIGRVDFLILSSKEEELKKMLSQMWDTIGSDNIVRFRFSRNAYITDGKYKLEQIVKDADMVIMADNALLYREPRLISCKDPVNSLYNRIRNFDLSKQIRSNIQSGKSDIPVIWDTMQQIVDDGQEGFWSWKSRELDSKILEFINRTMREQKDKSIVILSSNEHILSEIYQKHYMRAFRKKYNGKSITVLHFASVPLLDLSKKESKITCSLSEIYDEVLGLEDMPQKLLPELEDIVLEFWYDIGITYCQCTALIREDGTELPKDWKKQCYEWLNWQFNEVFKKKNVLTDYFRELWRNQLNAGGYGIFCILLAENLCKGVPVSYSFKEEYLNLREDRGKKERNCIQAVEVHEMLQFIRQKPVIDERAVSQFRERFDVNLLKKILNTENCGKLLDKTEYDRLIKLGERIRDN